MAGLAALTGTAAVPLVLVLSLAGHLRGRSLAAALRAQAAVPSRLAPPVASLAVTAEVGVLGVLLLGLALRRTDLAHAALAAATALFVLYAAYAAYVTRTRPVRVPCGCGGDLSTPMSAWVVARAAGLAVLALGGALASPPPLGGATASGIVAGAALGVLLWVLPRAMDVSEGSLG
ncbi:MauE/DoxX family redox-associated membrane protein [Actinomadura harenae]|uniref:Methylamine utilization protein MauE n=1 Tax=Actinomadura harenae TaxID=2483351 RepID=A0A3M2LW88_9ACTN|nr:MauE/DoxX family redox-associated membrane protein [Actinomadura harenae]RMI40813.1 methylamine utilization protein MauE [Actinomadura harenae]